MMGTSRRHAAMAPTTHPDSSTATLAPADRIWWRTAPGGPRVIGYDRDGEMIWASAGGRGTTHGIGGISFAVDDRDGDDPDDFDESDDEADDDEYEVEDRDEDDDEDDDERETGDEDDEEDPRERRRRDQQDNRWQPPTQTEWEKVQEAQRRNNGELQRNREARKILKRLNVRDAGEFADFLIQRGIDPDSGDPLDGGVPNDTDTDARRQEAATQHRRSEQRGAERESARWRPAVVQFAAADAFRDAGFSGGSLNRVLRLLDTDAVDVEFDDNGEVVVYGLDDQVKTIKGDLPELFKPRRENGRRTRDDEGGQPERPARRREGGRRIASGARAVDGGDRGRSAAKPMTWIEKTDRAMRGLPAEPRGRRR